METFDELQDIWRQQPDHSGSTSAAALMQKGEVHLKKLRAGHVGTIVTISVWLCVLIGYFVAVRAYRMNELTIGLSLMITMMLMLVFFEWLSVSKFNRIRPDNSLSQFCALMEDYYIWRGKMHRIFIPSIYVLYIIGFTFLLPAFKANLSPGFYLYCLISGYGFLGIFSVFIVRTLKKERERLEFLINLE